MKARPLFDPPDRPPGDPGQLRQAGPADALEEPGDVRGRDRLARSSRSADRRDIVSSGPVAFDASIAFWLWFTVIFANFAEAMAEGRGKAQADACGRRAPIWWPGG